MSSKLTVLHFRDAELSALVRELATRMKMPLTHAVKIAVKRELGMKHPEDVMNVSPAIGHLKAALASLERHQKRRTVDIEHPPT